MGIGDRTRKYLVKKLGLGSKSNSNLQGSQESLASFGSVRNNYDLELTEQPIRSPLIAAQLMDLEKNSYIVRHTLLCASRDTFASSDGDEQGFIICDTLKDNETPVNPEIKAIALEVINRENFDHHVIGGERLKRGLMECLMMGNGYLELGIEKEGIGRNDYCVADSMYLPTWEMFRVTTPQGRTIQYEQRRNLTSKDPDYTFYPFKIIDMCHHPYRKYGRSLWSGNMTFKAWKNLKNATDALARGALELGYNPTVHSSARFSDAKARQRYADEHEQRKATGIITDLYISNNSSMAKLANVNPNLTPLVENVLHQRYGMIPAGYPTYLYPSLSLNTAGAKEISNQPALIYSRIRHDNCAIVAKAAKQVIKLELVLKLGYERAMELLKESPYRLEFPKWKTTPHEDESAEKDEKDNMNGNRSQLEKTYF